MVLPALVAANSVDNSSMSEVTTVGDDGGPPVSLVATLPDCSLPELFLPEGLNVHYPPALEEDATAPPEDHLVGVVPP